MVGGELRSALEKELEVGLRSEPYSAHALDNADPDLDVEDKDEKIARKQERLQTILTKLSRNERLYQQRRPDR